MIELSKEERQISREFLIAVGYNEKAEQVGSQVEDQLAMDIRTVLASVLEVPYPPVAYEENRIEEFYERLSTELFSVEER